MRLINEKLNNYNKYNTLDYFNLPEGSAYQLIEGELVITPAPTLLIIRLFQEI